MQEAFLGFRGSIWGLLFGDYGLLLLLRCYASKAA